MVRSEWSTPHHRSGHEAPLTFGFLGHGSYAASSTSPVPTLLRRPRWKGQAAKAPPMIPSKLSPPHRLATPHLRRNHRRGSRRRRPPHPTLASGAPRPCVRPIADPPSHTRRKSATSNDHVPASQVNERQRSRRHPQVVGSRASPKFPSVPLNPSSYSIGATEALEALATIIGIKKTLPAKRLRQPTIDPPSTSSQPRLPRNAGTKSSQLKIPRLGGLTTRTGSPPLLNRHFKHLP